VERVKIVNKTGKLPKLSVTRIDRKPGDFPLGSASSRAAARAQLKNIKDAQEWEATRPPDLRIIWGIPEPFQRMKTEVRRSLRKDKIVEDVFPSELYHGESLGCCFVEPTNISVDETLRLLREHRRREAAEEDAPVHAVAQKS
jgi:hypothetical protein